MQTIPAPRNRLLVFLLLLAGLWTIPVQAAHSAGLRIIYSNDVRGELEPCG